jgi:hypothetical protein
VSTTYRLTAVGIDGSVKDFPAEIEVVEPLRVVSFVAAPDRISLGGQFSLAWEIHGGSEVVIELAVVPSGSRASFKLTTGPKGSQTIKVDPREFTRFGDYEYRLTARGFGEPVQANTKVSLR